MSEHVAKNDTRKNDTRMLLQSLNEIEKKDISDQTKTHQKGGGYSILFFHTPRIVGKVWGTEEKYKTQEESNVLFRRT